MQRPLALFLITGLAASSAAAASLPGAIATLEVHAAGHGSEPAAAPLRFALMQDRRVFVAGSHEILSAVLGKQELKPLEKQIDRVRKLKGVPSELRLGPGDDRYRLRIEKGGFVVNATGDPAFASAALRPLGELLIALSTFEHASLRRHVPSELLLGSRRGELVGGCRAWTLPVPLEESLAGPRIVPAAAGTGWPRGAWPASVCADGKRYIVTLRPLLPGERP